MRKPGAVMTRVIQAMLERRDRDGLEILVTRYGERADRAWDRGASRMHQAWLHALHAAEGARVYLERVDAGRDDAWEIAARTQETITDFRKLREPDFGFYEQHAAHGESWGRAAVFHAADCADFTDDEIIGLTGFHEYGHAAGRPFAHEPWIYRRGSRVVVKWSGGLDV